MKFKSKSLWAVVLSGALAFTVSVHPVSVHASSTVENRQITEKPTSQIQENIQDQKATGNPNGATTNTTSIVEPEILPLVLPIAAAGFTWTIIDSIFAATLGYYVGSSDLFKSAVNDKQASSTIQYGTPSSSQIYPSYPDFAGFTIATSATKHMEAPIVSEVHNRIKNYGNGTNLRVYSSTKFPSNLMAVIDISSPLGGVVNRHLGNFLSGAPMKDPTYTNEWLELSGYSIFIISDKNTNRVFHAHFTPTRLRDYEIEYNRYVGQFDTQIFPFSSRNTKYLDTNYSFNDDKKNAMYNRGLLNDTKGNPSVIPYK